VLAGAVARLADGGHGVRLAVDAAALDALMILADRHAERVRRVAAIARAKSADPLLERVVMAHRAWAGIELASPDADACARLARQALDGDLLLAEAHRRSAYIISTRALTLTDDAGAGRAIDPLREEATARRSRLRGRCTREPSPSPITPRASRSARRG
jgi:hypothetical protein